MRFQLNTIRITAIARKIPTPTETVRISIIFSSPLTCSARITRSGSEIVTRIPIIKLINAMIHTFLLAPTVEPIFEPRGCIDISAPAVNRLIPNTRQTTPTINRNISPVEIGTMVMLSARTISAIGNTDFRDSKNLSLIRFNFVLSFLIADNVFHLYFNRFSKPFQRHWMKINFLFTNSLFSLL